MGTGIWQDYWKQLRSDTKAKKINEKRSKVMPRKAGRRPPPAEQTLLLNEPGCLATLSGRVRHNRRNLRKDRADAGRNARHNRAGGDGHETRHQSIFDEVLTARVLPNLQLQNEILHVSLYLLPSGARQVSVAVQKYHRQVFERISVNA